MFTSSPSSKDGPKNDQMWLLVWCLIAVTVFVTPPPSLISLGRGGGAVSVLRGLGVV